MAELNTQLLISLMEGRPVLWDKTIDIYKDEQRTFEAWREIFTILNNDFEKLGKSEKTKYGILVMKKWTCLRNGWLNCHRRLNTWKPKSRANELRKYINYDKMSFLKKSLSCPDPVPSSDNTTANEDVFEKYSAKKEIQEYNTIKRKKTPLTTMFLRPRSTRTAQRRKVKDARLLEENKEAEESLISEQMEDNREIEPNIVPKPIIEIEPIIKVDPIIDASPSTESAMTFFRDIAPMIDEFSDNEMLDFQYEVMQAARNIDKRRNACYI